MEFKLFSKLASLEGIDLYMLLGALVVLGLLIWAVAAYAKRTKAKPTDAPEAAAGKPGRTQVLVYGALSITLAFVLSYFKLFTLPYEGSVTLLSMLPIFAYAAYFGPARGFTAAFAFSLLQVIQGAYIIHPIQFILDYFVAFTCLGLASFFPKNLPLGAAVGGFARMMASTVSGVVFFGSYAADYGFTNVWAYSLVYNFFSIGVDTILCVIVASLPPVQRLFKRVFSKA
ncbi:MAG: energy-coupled thiamine transporter ThiT [Clostridiales bacterium]|nr:energy-coupled thiamine transporter ThiT [Clostridiales bacterium]